MRFLGLGLVTLTSSMAHAASNPVTHVYLFGRISVGFSDEALFLGDGAQVLELRRDGSRRTFATVQTPVTTIDATPDGRFVLVGDTGVESDCYGDGSVPSGRLTMFTASGAPLWIRSGRTFEPRVIDGVFVIRYPSGRRLVEETLEPNTGRTVEKRRTAMPPCPTKSARSRSPWCL